MKIKINDLKKQLKKYEQKELIKLITMVVFEHNHDGDMQWGCNRF